MIFNMMLLALSVMMGGAIFYRLNKLDIKEHKLTVILFNVGLLGSLASVGEHAWIDALDLQDWCILLACGCWVLLSHKAWEDKPPEYARK